jgi:putative ABC transport system permease protein
LLVNEQVVRVLARSNTLARFPPRPLLYTTSSNARRILPVEPRTLTFVLVIATHGIDVRGLARRIELATGLRARAADDFKADTVRWYLVNSEDVGDIAAMLTLAMTMGLGLSGIMFYMFTLENQRHYAVLKALGAAPRSLQGMVLVQAAVCAAIGSGIGLGLCALARCAVLALGFPFRMMWFTPLVGLLAVVLVAALAAIASAFPVTRAAPADVFAGR